MMRKFGILLASAVLISALMVAGESAQDATETPQNPPRDPLGDR